MTSQALQLVSNEVPAHVLAATGLGNEGVTAEHMQMPRLKQLQSISNEIDENHPDYVNGAKNGMFLSNVGLFGNQTLFPTNIHVINLKFEENFVVWRDRKAGGGMLGNFKSLADATQAVVDASGKAEDYQINQTHDHFLVLKNPETGELSNPTKMSFARSKITTSKNWNTNLMSLGGNRFSSLWTLRSYQKETNSGKFMVVDADYVGFLTEDDYAIALATYNQIK